MREHNINLHEHDMDEDARPSLKRAATAGLAVLLLCAGLNACSVRAAALPGERAGDAGEPAKRDASGSGTGTSSGIGETGSTRGPSSTGPLEGRRGSTPPGEDRAGSAPSSGAILDPTGAATKTSPPPGEAPR